VSIVMGLDQHRGQITREWIDTETGEVQRSRVTPADRARVREWLERFRGQKLEVALEATTGWRFLVEELRRVGAVVHLAEPAETAGLKGPKKRAKNDRADARHLRELLMVGRLPESWISPDHVLDLRARVRLRHELGEQRSEWQQRIQAVLYHHGCPQRRQLMVGDGREWLAAQPLPETAREQVTVALAMIDAVDLQMRPIEKQLRAYARRQAGCKALMAHYGSRSSPSSATAHGSPPRARPFATPGWTSPSISQISAARPGTSPGRAHQRCARRCTRRPRSLAVPARRIVTTTCKPPSGSAVTVRVCRSRASCSSAATTRCASLERRRSLPHELLRCASRPFSNRCAAASSRHVPAATFAWTAQKD
jgi:Transposase